MRLLLSIVVLTWCLCGSTVFAQEPGLKAGSIQTAILDANTNDSGPIGAIVNAINKMDAWIQKNLW